MPPAHDHAADWVRYLTEAVRSLGVRLTADQAEQCARFKDMLLQWNRKINLTAITDPLEIAVKHFADAMAPRDLFDDSENLLDMGAGAGFPGIPLKILLPGIRLTLIDSVRKKISFINEVVRDLKLQNAKAIHTRAEALKEQPEFLHPYDAIISRAFSDLNIFVSLALPLVRPGGRILAMKGPQFDPEIQVLRDSHFLARDGRQIRFSDADIHVRKYSLPVSGNPRTLITIQIPG